MMATIQDMSMITPMPIKMGFRIRLFVSTSTSILGRKKAKMESKMGKRFQAYEVVIKARRI